MLKRLKINNFRTHENLEMEFDKGLNVIYGLGQSGKTNILRSFNLLSKNRPTGFGMHSHFAQNGHVFVEGEFDNCTVSIDKTKTKTVYKLNEHEFAFPKSSVPVQIEEAINMSEINFSEQLDKPFLITESPQEVGRILNKITKIEQIDQWVSSLTTTINSTNRIVESLGTELDSLETKYARYEILDTLEKQVNEFNDIETKLGYVIDKHDTLVDLFNYITESKQKMAKLNIEWFEKALRECTEIDDQLSGVYDTLHQLQTIKKDLSVKGVLKKEIENIIQSVGDNLDQLSAIEQQVELNSHIKNELLKYRQQLNNLEENTVKLEQYKKRYIQEIKDMKICPTCQNPITAKHIKQLEDSL